MSTKEKLSSVRGMNDVLPPQSDRWRFFEDHCRAVFEQYGYHELRTPILESTAVFRRGVGETTDIVAKEMYTFEDRKGRSLTMRPEMTAGCARAYVQHAVHKLEPVTRWYYAGPMFRYERMQAGRYRQFYQVGVEVLGIAEPTIDVEIIGMLHRLYGDIGIDSEVQLNSVGSAQDRPAYRQQLIGYFTPHKRDLCGDCKRRLEQNPLRILDCKVASCRTLIANAPSVVDALGEASTAHFTAVQRGLESLGVPFRLVPTMVRGLDYYTGTVFEFVTAAKALGSQGTIVAGGRYNNLIEQLGGPSTPAIGFSIGVERSVMILGDVHAAEPLDVFFISHGVAARERALALAHTLRQRGVSADMEHRDVSIKAQFKRANKLSAQWAVIIGETELAANTVKLKHMESGDERDVGAELIADALTGR